VAKPLDLKVRVRGLTALTEGFRRAPKAIGQAVADASTLAGKRIIDTVGLGKYPPMGPGNQPPTPYYVRGEGTQLKSKNLHNSEKLGARFHSLGEARGLGAVIKLGNTASYAPYVVGDEQSRVMAKIGWRKLRDVAKQKLSEVGKIFEEVIGAALKQIGL